MKTLGARVKFSTKLNMLEQMSMACDLILNDDINDYMQKTNKRLYNKMLVSPRHLLIYLILTQVFLGVFWTIGSRKICQRRTPIRTRRSLPFSSRNS